MRSVPDSAPSVAELVWAQMAVVGVRSGREMGRRCGLSKDTAGKILSGRRPSPTEPTLRKLADGLGLPIQALREAAGRPRGEREPFVVPDWWHGLPSEHRDVLYTVAESLRRVNKVPTPIGRNLVAPIATHRAASPWAARHDDTNSPQVNPLFSDGT